MGKNLFQGARGAILAGFVAVAGALALAGAAAAEMAAPAPPPVVVELYTSQGCSSCPPADAYLQELAKQDGVLALSMHVDYWNGLGWPDPFSSTVVTDRQRAYRAALDGRYVYTPQMVIGGRTHAVGSHRLEVATAIAEVRRQMKGAPSLAVSHGADKQVTVRIGAGQASEPATLWLVAFDDRHTTAVPRGENAGRTLTYVNVVRDLRAVGTWTGEPREFTVDLADEVMRGFENCALILQSGRAGPVITALSMPLPR